MNEKQAIYALDNQVRALSRQNQEQQKRITELAQTVALMADAMAQHLDGRMDQRTTAGNLHNLNAAAAQLHRRAS